MIEILHGTHETVLHQERTGYKLYDNVEYEAYPAHWHVEPEIIMPILSGYEADINNVHYRLFPEDILIITSGVIHSLRPTDDKGRRIIFQPDFSLLHNVYGLESVLTLLPPVLCITPETDPDIHEKLRDIMLKIRDEYFSECILAEASIYSLLIEMYVLTGRKYSDRICEFDVTNAKRKEYSEKFTTICNYINEHFAEDLCLDTVSAQAGFSKYHFTRLFKQFTGYSFYKYLNHKRIECAEKLLINPDISVTEIATSSGFSSLSAFIRMFKQFKDCTPTEFRNMYNYCDHIQL